jgi:hypothetical protein
MVASSLANAFDHGIFPCIISFGTKRQPNQALMALMAWNFV